MANPKMRQSIPARALLANGISRHNFNCHCSLCTPAKQVQAIPVISDDVPRTTPIAKLFKLQRAAEAARLLRAELIVLLDHEGAEWAQMKLDEIERRIAEHTTEHGARKVTP